MKRKKISILEFKLSFKIYMYQVRYYTTIPGSYCSSKLASEVHVYSTAGLL